MNNDHLIPVRLIILAKSINYKSMKRILLTISMALFIHASFSQIIYDYKTKNVTNAKDRTMMLDIFRAKLYNDYKQEFVFVVNHFKVGNNYAWLIAEVQRKDGKKIQMPDDFWDCCHVEALFKKSRDKWLLVESSAFSTDVWWADICRRYPQAPKGIFDIGGCR
jgi:hypothetical protein